MQEAKKRKFLDVSGAILKTLGAAGLLSVAILAPNVVQVLGSFDDNRKRRVRRSYYVDSAIARLKKRGCIEFKKILKE